MERVKVTTLLNKKHYEALVKMAKELQIPFSYLLGKALDPWLMLCGKLPHREYAPLSSYSSFANSKIKQAREAFLEELLQEAATMLQEKYGGTGQGDASCLSAPTVAENVARDVLDFLISRINCSDLGGGGSGSNG